MPQILKWTILDALAPQLISLIFKLRPCSVEANVTQVSLDGGCSSVWVVFPG